MAIPIAGIGLVTYATFNVSIFPFDDERTLRKLKSVYKIS